MHVEFLAERCARAADKYIARGPVKEARTVGVSRAAPYCSISAVVLAGGNLPVLTASEVEEQLTELLLSPSPDPDHDLLTNLDLNGTLEVDTGL